jgi:hypothetical protein
MGNANSSITVRATLLAILGLLLIGVGLSFNASAAEGCSSQVQTSKDGAYAGCLVKMGNKEFTVGAKHSSAEGCSQVCGIMAEVGSSSRAGQASAKIDTSFHE